MNVFALRGPRCLCPRHREASLSFRFDGDDTNVFWNSHLIAGPFTGKASLAHAESWSKNHLPVEKACAMTVREREKRCCNEETHVSL